jgi:hypothetical protein
MHLCNIPEDKIPLVEIPTGLPLVYDKEQSCIRLLEEGDLNPFEKYNFGAAPELLFKWKKSKEHPDYWKDVIIKQPIQQAQASEQSSTSSTPSSDK